MSNIIRNYQSGARVTLSDWTRQHGIREQEISPEERLRRSAEQTQREAMALRQQAEALLAQAETQAQAIVSAAQEEAAVLQATAQAEGYEAGYAQGLAEGQAKGENSLSNSVNQVQVLLTKLATQREQLLRQAEPEVVHLTLAIVEKIVGQAAQSQQDLIVHTVNRALAELAVRGPFVVRIHPVDRELLLRYWQTNPDLAPNDEWELQSDPAVERGGCVLSCGPSTVDARLSTQMKSIVNALQIEQDS